MATNANQWLLEDEPRLYRERTGADPYAVWVSRLSGLSVERVPARLLAYVDKDHTKAAVIYLDGTRGTVRHEQMSARRQEPFAVLASSPQQHVKE